MTSTIDWLVSLVNETPVPSGPALAYRAILIACILLTTILAMVDTIPDAWAGYAAEERFFSVALLAVMTVDYALRLIAAARSAGPAQTKLRAIRHYATSFYGVFDFLAVLPFVLEMLVDLPHDGETIFGILRFVKLARYSPALETLGAVVASEARPLLAALFIMLLLAISASTLLYFAERDTNPGFQSVPHAMWWAIVTLATVGYGDVTPGSPVGKMLGSVVAVLGLCMFALPASILASGFSEELRRRSFVSTWRLVAAVPFFSKLQASQIADIAGLLKIMNAMNGETVVREGETGECMYFIASGQIEILAPGGSILLKPGDFFGEIALIERRPRTATARAVGRCQLLILEARDFHRFFAHDRAMLDTIQETAHTRLSSPH